MSEQPSGIGPHSHPISDFPMTTDLDIKLHVCWLLGQDKVLGVVCFPYLCKMYSGYMYIEFQSTEVKLRYLKGLRRCKVSKLDFKFQSLSNHYALIKKYEGCPQR